MASKPSSGCLPTVVQVAGHDLTLQPIKKGQVAEAYQLVCAEAKLGQDVGTDQYISEEHLWCYFKTVPSFSITETATGKLCAFIIIVPSVYSRSNDTVVADGIIICDAKVKAQILRTLVQVTQRLATDICYEGLLIEAFRGSIFGPILGEEGFTVIGCIPNSGKLINRGWTDSVVMYKDVKPLTNKKQSDKNQAQPPSKILDDTWYPKEAFLQKPQLTYLPFHYTLPTGKEVILRYIQEADIPQVYDMYKEASEKAEGYAVDEFESLEIFRFSVIDHGHAFVVEDPETSAILAQFSVSPNEFCRTVDPVNVDLYGVVNKNFRRGKIGSEALRLAYRFSLDLGYRAFSGDCLSEQFSHLHSLRKRGQVVVAQIPKAANGKNGELIDNLVLYTDIEDKSKLDMNVYGMTHVLL